MTYEFWADDPLLEFKLNLINVQRHDISYILDMPSFGHETLRFFSVPCFFGDSACVVIHPREAA